MVRFLYRFVSRATREAWDGARRRPLLPLAAFGALTICLTLSALVTLFAWNASRVAKTWSGGGQMTVYLDDDVTPARATQLTDAIRHLPGVTSAQLVGSKEAYERLKGALASRGDLLDGVEESFLPTSIDVMLVPGTSALLRAQPSFQRLSTAAGVQEVDLHAESVERLQSAQKLVTLGAWLFGMLAALATLYLVATTIRLGVAARRDELTVLRLVGATEAFVRAPFLVEGLCVGLLGALAALCATNALWRMTSTRIAAGLGDWLAAAPLSFFSWQVLLAGVAAGALLGLTGARAAFTGAARV